MLVVLSRPNMVHILDRVLEVSSSCNLAKAHEEIAEADLGLAFRYYLLSF